MQKFVEASVVHRNSIGSNLVALMEKSAYPIYCDGIKTKEMFIETSVQWHNVVEDNIEINKPRIAKKA